MRSLKKYLTMFLALAVILPCVFWGTPTTVLADSSGDFEYTLDDENNATITRYTGSADVLEIPGELDGYMVTRIWNFAFTGCDSLESVTIPESVTSIEGWAFSYCDSLESVTIPESVTCIGEYAFLDTAYYNDDNNWDNGVLYIGNYLIKAKDEVSGNYDIRLGTKLIAEDAFYGCRSLESVTIPEGVTSIGNMAFIGCWSLASVTIPEGVEYIGNGAFSGTAYYDDDNNWYNDVLYIGNYLIEAKDDISGNCDIRPGTKLIADMAFYGCESLASLTIPEGVTSIGAKAFSICHSLSSVTIPEGVTSIGADAFLGCRSLESVKIPESVKFVGSGAFYGCSSLESAILLNSPDKIEADTFAYCSSLRSIEIPRGVTEIVYDAFKGCTALGNVSMPGSVKKIEHNSFDECESLKDVYFDGTENRWSEVEIENGNGPLIYAKMHYLATDVSGDANGDGEVNSDDAISLLRFFAGWNEPIAEAVSDLNGDGKVDSNDVIHLLRYLAGWDVKI